MAVINLTNKNLIIYLLLTALIVCIGVICGYLIIRPTNDTVIHISADFNNFFVDYWNLIKILLLEFIFGFSILSTPICFVLLFHQSFIYGHSIFITINSVNRIDLIIFYFIIYFLVLLVYSYTTMMTILYSKRMATAVPNLKETLKLDSTIKYIKNYIICFGILILVQLIKIGYLKLF